MDDQKGQSRPIFISRHAATQAPRAFGDGYSDAAGSLPRFERNAIARDIANVIFSFGMAPTETGWDAIRGLNQMGLFFTPLRSRSSRKSGQENGRQENGRQENAEQKNKDTPASCSYFSV
jgi:hypothetical protein